MRCLCLHAISRVGHARLVEADALHVGSAPGGDQQHVALELAHLAAAAAAAAAARHAHAHAPPLEGGHLLHLHAQLEGDAVGRERRVHRRRRLRVRAWQQPRAALDARDLVRVRLRLRLRVWLRVRLTLRVRLRLRVRVRVGVRVSARDLAPEGGEGLRHLERDRAAAEHHQPLGQRGQVVQRRVRHVRRRRQPRHVGHRGASARGDHSLPEAQRRAVDLHRVRPGEAPPPLEDVDTCRGRRRVRVGGSDRGAQPPHAAHDRAEVDGGWRPRDDDAKLGRAPHLLDSTCAAKECLGGDAAHVEAVATGQMLAYHRRACAAPAALLGRDQPAGSSADCNQVILDGGRRVLPPTRADGIQRGDVVLVQRPHLEGACLVVVAVPRHIRPARSRGDLWEGEGSSGYYTAGFIVRLYTQAVIVTRVDFHRSL